MIFNFSKRFNLLQIPGFRWFLISRFATTLATGMTYIVMTWFLLDKVNQMSSIALLMICFWIPSAVVGPLTGVMVDKYAQQYLLIITNFLRLLGYGFFFFSLSAVTFPVQIYGLALFQGLISSIQDPLQTVFIRKMVEDSDLIYANTTLDIVYELGNVGGMGLAGFLLLILSWQQIVLFLIFLSLIAVLSAFLIKNKNLFYSAGSRIKTKWYDDLIASFFYLKYKHILSILYIIQLLIMIEFMTAPILLAFYAKNVLYASAAQFGQMEAGLSVGLVLGGLIMPWCINTFTEKQVALFGSLGCIIVFFLIEIGHNIFLTEGVYFLFGLCLMIWPLILTKAQSITDPAYQGRVSALFNAVSSIIILLVYLSIYFFGDIVALHHLYQFEIVLALTISFLIWQYYVHIKVHNK
jgi:DHA3 family macrolide efflux protein-like MFS transporter